MEGPAADISGRWEAVAGPVRLERTTCRLGGGCSIH